MARPEKTAAVAELVEDFKSAQATFLTEYRGLSVTSLKALRRSLGNETKYSVVKNTLTKIAAKDAGVDIDEALLAGPSALAFIKGDPIAAAKSLKTFQKENPALVIKGGIYEGKRVTAAEIMELADLESREVLLSKLAGAMKASMAKAARAFDALRIKMESGAPASEAAPAAEAPAAEAVTEAVAEAPVAEAPAAEAPVAEAAEAPAAEATPEVSTESTTEATPE